MKDYGRQVRKPLPLDTPKRGRSGLGFAAVCAIVTWGHVTKDGFSPRTGEKTSEVLQL